jgi:hypothetical protein
MWNTQYTLGKMLQFLMLRVLHTLTRVLEIVCNSCRYLGITDLAWQLVITMPTNWAVWSMSSNGGPTFDIIPSLSSHQKFKQAQSLWWYSVLKTYFLQKNAIVIHRINHYVISVKHSAVFVLCCIFELKNKLRNNWKSHFPIIVVPTVFVKCMLPLPPRSG